MKPRSWRWCLLAAVVLAAAGCAKKADSRSEKPSQPAEGIVIDQRARSVSVPATVAQQELHKVLRGAIEYVLVGEGGKEYETVFATRHPVEEIGAALLKIGLRPGLPGEEDLLPHGMPVLLFVEYAGQGGSVRRPLDEFVLRVWAPGPGAGGAEPAPRETARPLAPAAWTFTGSAAVLDPETNRRMLQASLTRSIIGLHTSDASPLVQNPRPESRHENIYRANVAALPRPGTEVRVIFQRPPPRPAEGDRRVHLRIGGILQGVGFDKFIEGQARRLKLAGFLRNFPDGHLEAVVEGPAAGVAELLDKIKRGRPGAHVEALQVTDEGPEGDFQSFEIWY